MPYSKQFASEEPHPDVQILIGSVFGMGALLMKVWSLRAISAICLGAPRLPVGARHVDCPAYKHVVFQGTGSLISAPVGCSHPVLPYCPAAATDPLISFLCAAEQSCGMACVVHCDVSASKHEKKYDRF